LSTPRRDTKGSFNDFLIRQGETLAGGFGVNFCLQSICNSVAENTIFLGNTEELKLKETVLKVRQYRRALGDNAK
jgi:hypothetical protein